MSVESAADRAAFFNTDEFGASATVTPNGSPSRTINVIFDAAARDEVGVILAGTQITARTSDTSDLADGDAVVVNGETYTLREVRADGTGVSLLILEDT